MMRSARQCFYQQKPRQQRKSTIFQARHKQRLVMKASLTLPLSTVENRTRAPHQGTANLYIKTKGGASRLKNSLLHLH